MTNEIVRAPRSSATMQMIPHAVQFQIYRYSYRTSKILLFFGLLLD